jgi:phage shock protein A
MSVRRAIAKLEKDVDEFKQLLAWYDLRLSFPEMIVVAKNAGVAFEKIPAEVERIKTALPKMEQKIAELKTHKKSIIALT